jgi:hypothetical protein
MKKKKPPLASRTIDEFSQKYFRLQWRKTHSNKRQTESIDAEIYFIMGYLIPGIAISYWKNHK